MALQLKPEWIINQPDGSEIISPVILEDMANAIRALQSIHTGEIIGGHSHKDTVAAMRQIAGKALIEIGGGFEPLVLEQAGSSPCTECGLESDSADCPHGDEAMRAAARQVSLIGRSNPSMYAIGNMDRALWIAKTAVNAYLDAKKTERCPICHWPMAATVKEGCVPGNCSYRGSNPAQKPVSGS